MKKQITLFFGLLLSFLTYAQQTISITKLGYIPNSHKNAVPFINKAIELSKKMNGKTLIIFPKGRYDFYPEQSAEKEFYESNSDVIPFRICPILMEDLNNLTIDGNGSDFIFHGRMQPFTINNSHHITIKNINIDWDIPMTAQAQVMKVTEDYIDLKIADESPYLIEKDKLVFTGEGWKSRMSMAMEFDKDSKLIAAESEDRCLGNNWGKYKATEIEKGLVRFTYPFTRKPKTGNYLVLRHSERDHAGVLIQYSKDIAIENMNIFQTAGLGILSQYTENVSFKKVKSNPNQKKNRYFSGHDDGLHISNCKGKIVIDSCSFSGLMDDPINVHGTSVLITEKINNRQLKCKFVHPQSIGFRWAENNDHIGFIENQSMSTIGFGKVLSFKKLSPTEFELLFEENIPDQIKVGNALENLTWTPDVTIRNSYFGSNRARGILVSTPGQVLIENNVFESSGSAILIPGDANGWYESGAVKNVTIRKNIFKEACLSSIYQFCEGIISIDPEIPKPQLNQLFHRNIRIEQNTFHPFDYPVLYAKSTNGLIFNNNKIERSKKYTPFHPRKYMISLENCKNIEVLNNHYKGEVLGKNILLKGTAANELKEDHSLQMIVDNK